MTENTISDERRYNFFIIDNEVVDDYDLNPYAGWLYVTIVRHVNHQKGVAFPSLSKLAEKTHMTEPTVVKYLKILEEKNLITITPQYDPETKTYKSNHYTVVGVVKEVNQGGKADLGGVVKEVNSKKTNIEKDEENKKDQKIAPSGARQFYAEDNLTDDKWNILATGKQPHVAIIEDGYLVGLRNVGRPLIEANPIPRRAGIAVAIVKNGVSWLQVFDFIQHLYNPSNKSESAQYWQKRDDPISLEHIAALIGKWIEDSKPPEIIDFGGDTFEDVTARALAYYETPEAKAQIAEILAQEGIDATTGEH